MNSDYQQMPFGGTDFAENPENRCPCLLLLDTSGSMQGQPIKELNEGLALFREELASDAMASKRVELGIVTFGPVAVVTEFVTPDLFIAPTLSANGDTPMGAAIERAIQMVSERKNVYKANGIAYYRPWIFMITDGGPTDQWQSAASRVREGEAAKQFQFFAVGVQGANMDVLRQISVREVLSLQGLKFRELFSWLSNSMAAVSQSSLGDKVELPSPAGWASV